MQHNLEINVRYLYLFFFVFLLIVFFHSLANFIIAKQLCPCKPLARWEFYSNTPYRPRGPTKLSAEHTHTLTHTVMLRVFTIPHTCLGFCGWTKKKEEKKKGLCCLHLKCFLPSAKLIRIVLKSAINSVDYIQMNACESKLSFSIFSGCKKRRAKSKKKKWRETQRERERG